VALIDERRKMPTGLCLEKLRDRGNLGRPVCGRVDNIEIEGLKYDGNGLDWIDLAQDNDLCRAVVNAVMKPRVQKMLGIT
jgi:hypothetical protein